MPQVTRGRPASIEERQAISQAARRGTPVGIGLTSHFHEVKHLSPDVAAVDMLSFVASITTAGVITQPSKQNTHGGYITELFGIRAFMQKPSEDPDFAPYVSFNIKDQNRGYLFSTDIELSYLIDVTSGGSGNPIEFNRGVYVFDPGTTIDVKFSVTSDYTSATATKKWGIVLLCNTWAV